ncbi:MAG: DUF1292 domain-containing protein [Oscillospiraceae bacterium]|nr:DUF1292 domain-containing protein [Oscillospiraceae bacterium]
MEFSPEIITLTDEDGKNVDFEVITKLDIEENEYVIVLPIEDEALEEEGIILKITKLENGEEGFITVEDDDEYQTVVDAYELWNEENDI